jgi:hypothetical protein
MEGDIESGQAQSKNLRRREARSHRRQPWRRARRMAKTFNLLRQFGLPPSGGASTPEKRQDLINRLDQAIRASDWFMAKASSGGYPQPEQTLPYVLRGADSSADLLVGLRKRELDATRCADAPLEHAVPQGARRAVAHFFRRQLFAQAGHVAQVPGHRADKSGRYLGIPPAQVRELAVGKEKEGEILHSSAPPLRDGAGARYNVLATGP